MVLLPTQVDKETFELFSADLVAVISVEHHEELVRRELSLDGVSHVLVQLIASDQSVAILVNLGEKQVYARRESPFELVFAY